ncbi:GNAT family N-acetyltransferase [Rudaeicoccus suwonensis]|uniref:GNAT family N-acetyltransferase n=1 Tax=Rudaeicoccus suwonensis TaxID=657409 RepID=UPI001FEB9592|nr:GNAT family N-acetyltransferase [Rudaeicoccus suwonensis]
MITLIQPTVDLHQQWLASYLEFGDDVAHGYGDLRWSVEKLSSSTGFADFVTTKLSYADPATIMPEGLVHDSLFWVVDDAAPRTILGSLSLRHTLNDFLLREGGHIGYGVRPSARRRGIATAALRLGLVEATSIGLQRVLVTCDTDNVASAKTIERCGGRLEDIRGTSRRYWIELT